MRIAVRVVENILKMVVFGSFFNLAIYAAPASFTIPESKAEIQQELQNLKKQIPFLAGNVHKYYVKKLFALHKKLVELEPLNESFKQSFSEDRKRFIAAFPAKCRARTGVTKIKSKTCNSATKKEVHSTEPSETVKPLREENRADQIKEETVSPSINQNTTDKEKDEVGPGQTAPVVDPLSGEANLNNAKIEAGAVAAYEEKKLKSEAFQLAEQIATEKETPK